MQQAGPSPSPSDAGLTASDWLSSGLSALALVVSIFALAFTLLWRSRPLIRFEGGVVQNNDSSEANPTWRIRIANRGNGEAWDVRLNVIPGDGLQVSESVGTLHPDQTYDQALTISPFEPFDPAEPAGAGAWSSEPVDESKLRLIIRWRALPFIGWYRRKTVKVGDRVEELTWYDFSDESDLGKSRLDD